GGQPRGPGAVGGPVRRLRQRRPDHRRPVPLGRRGQVGPALQPGPAAPPRLRGPGPRALQRTPGAGPRPGRRGPHGGPRPPRPSRANRKPRVVMTPNSLPRLPAARSTAEQLTAGQFSEVLPDPARPSPDKVSRVLLCSGKGYYELAKRRADGELDQVALVRGEQLYPFPARALRAQLDAYPGAERILWGQEEPGNMGAWRYVRLKAEQELGLRLEPVSRDEGAAPAAGRPTLPPQEGEEVSA